MLTLQDDLTDAICREDVAAVRNLLAAGASPDDPNSKGQTPLCQAAEMESLGISRLLLESGANVNKPGFAGWTPLHVAVDSSIDGSIQTGESLEPTDVIELLLLSGADLDARTDDGKTPLSIAERYGSKEVLALLRKFRARQ